MAEIPSNHLNALIRNTPDTLVVVKFGAPWCGPCNRVAPEFEKYQKECVEMQSSVRCASVNIDTMDAEDYGVRTIPAFVVWFGGREIVREQTSDIAAVRRLVSGAFEKVAAEK
jgi:thiol-disulfide isomerase/thioredoxin